MPTRDLTHSTRSPAPLRTPPPTAYLQLAAAVGTTLGRSPFPRPSGARRALLHRIAPLRRELAALARVDRATVYEATLTPPAPPVVARRVPHVAAYDVVVLIEIPSPDDVAGVQASDAYRRLHAELAAAARDLLVMDARCLRFAGDVDKSRPGLFLFNYFAAADREAAAVVWERAAAWYAAKTGLDNSTLLAPVTPGPFAFVNHARWDTSLPAFAARQFLRPSFYSEVLGDLRAHHVEAMPILYRLAA